MFKTICIYGAKFIQYRQEVFIVPSHNNIHYKTMTNIDLGRLWQTNWMILMTQYLHLEN